MLGDSISDFVTFENRRFNRHDNSGREASFDSGFRLAAIQLVVLACFLVLFAGLVNNQIFAGSYYRGLADGNRIRSIPIHAPRGIIMDRNGTPLTVNLPSFRLVECDDAKKCQSQSISKDQAISLDAAGLSKNQQLEVDSSRSYPNGADFAHVLGYVSEISPDELKTDGSYLLGDKIGRGGIEEAQELRLRGVPGKELIEVDATGKKLRTLSIIDPKSGENITTSLDKDLQTTAVDAIGSHHGAIVVSNPQTGEILALVSSPSFDPNYFTDLSLSASQRTEKLQGIFNDPGQALFNRSVSGSFPPGSTFKLVTATAGLETGAIKPTTIIEDTGVLVIGPYKFPNWKWLANGGVEGNLDVVGGIQKSNDIFFYKTGELTGIDSLMDWAKKFGLGSKLGIDLPGENPGLVPDRAWRDANARSWYLGDTYHVAIGQGDLLVTPIQDNAWTNVIANGGKLCTPHLVTESNPVTQLPNLPAGEAGKAVTQCKNIGIKPETIKLITEGMVAACTPGGTGYPLFGFKPQVACKTGTAEFGTESKTHAWFTAFAPADKPTISVTVLVEGGGEGSDIAAPMAKKVLEEWVTEK